MGEDVSAREDTNILSCYDAFDIGEGYTAAMQWAVGSGIVEGDGKGNLLARSPLTRAQTAVILRRFLTNSRAVPEI